MTTALATVNGFKLSQFRPGPSDRAMFIGITGSGKTTVAEYLLRWRTYRVVLDVKGTITWAGYERHESLDTLMRSDGPRLLYRPAFEELENEEVLDSFFRWVYLRKNCTCYVDEIQGVASATRYPLYLAACLQRGRERGVSLWASTQRPAKIPLIFLTESEHCFTFRLKLPEDRDRMEEVTGVAAETVAQLPKHFFLYTPLDGKPVGPLTLDLP